MIKSGDPEGTETNSDNVSTQDSRLPPTTRETPPAVGPIGGLGTEPETHFGAADPCISARLPAAWEATSDEPGPRSFALMS